MQRPFSFWNHSRNATIKGVKKDKLININVTDSKADRWLKEEYKDRLIKIFQNSILNSRSLLNETHLLSVFIFFTSSIFLVSFSLSLAFTLEFHRTRTFDQVLRKKIRNRIRFALLHQWLLLRQCRVGKFGKKIILKLELQDLMI